MVVRRAALMELSTVDLTVESMVVKMAAWRAEKMVEMMAV